MKSTLFIYQLTVIAALVSQGLGASSCLGRCGDDDHTDGCQCNSLCVDYGDCCTDFEDICLSCQDRCGEGYVFSKPCQCNSECPSHGNCCHDFDLICDGGSGGEVTNEEIKAMTEELISLDVNNVASLIQFDLQGTTSPSDTNDRAPTNFFVSVPDEALQGATYQRVMALRDNYVPDVDVTENETSEELDETNAFLDSIMTTQVMKRTEEFLSQKNLISGNLRDVLDTIWFNLYSRASKSSSGAEHVMFGEIKNGKVSGFHNWVNFYHEEQSGALDYQGYMNIVDLGDKGNVMVGRFKWNGYRKDIASMFIGTSPELELASYTLCFFARPDGDCAVRMNGQDFTLVTYPMNYGGEELVGTAYPDIPF